MNPLTFQFDGKPVPAESGQTIAAALWAAGIRALRRSTVRGEARGMFCGMGICQECVVWIDGRRHESCLTIVQPGHSVSSGPNGKR
jgi:aerobic-type carbon monoxide dehydrogenase small subunit (CoxS/CutS family)